MRRVQITWFITVPVPPAIFNNWILLESHHGIYTVTLWCMWWNLINGSGNIPQSYGTRVHSAYWILSCCKSFHKQQPFNRIAAHIYFHFNHCIYCVFYQNIRINLNVYCAVSCSSFEGDEYFIYTVWEAFAFILSTTSNFDFLILLRDGMLKICIIFVYNRWLRTSTPQSTI